MATSKTRRRLLAWLPAGLFAPFLPGGLGRRIGGVRVTREGWILRDDDR